MAIWKLTIEDDEGQKTVVPLVRDEYTIGRREGHTIRLTERNVSRDHARIRKAGDVYTLEDLGSYNGVFINGHRVAEAVKIQTGDLILIGDYRIEAHNEEAPKVVAPVPVAAPQPPKSVSAPPVAKPQPPARETKPHRLVLLTGAEGGKEFPLDKATMIVGRGEEVDVRVNHSSVSRQHCELRTADHEHFEVYDSGSANGIRVNGQEVKKALLTSGDTLELGDVQLKYVAAGQAYVYDAAAAEAAREMGERRGKKGGVTWAVIAVLVIGAAVGGVLLARGSGHEDLTTPANASSGTSTSSSDDALSKAYKKKQDGDALGAHDDVKTFAKDSPLVKDKRYVEIENAWADKTIAAVKAEPDVDKKKGLLKDVLNSGADESYRTTAADMLSELDGKTSPSASTAGTVVAPTPTATETAPTPTTKPQPTTTSKPTATATQVVTSKPTATATTAAPTSTGSGGKCSSWKGDYTAAMRAKEYDCVRSMLLPRLNGGAISTGEARYLKAACQALGDTACEKRAAEKL